MATMGAFWEKASIYLNLPKITMTDVVEILIITFLFYYMLVWIKNTRAWVLLKGIMVILLFVLVAAVFQMNTIIWIAKNTLSVAITAIVIIFQPEIRKALENLGQKNFLTSFFTFDFSKGEIAKFTDKTINELVKACYEMGKVKTGALIVIEDEIVLSEYERTGIAVDGILTSQLLINIFEKNTPLHDGAVIVRGDRVVSATCYLPLTDSLSISKDLGTRHRAAVGISEVSDSLTIVVSEETGKVSIAMGGELYRNVDAEYLYSIARRKFQKLNYGEGGLRMLKNLAKKLTNNLGLKVLAVLFAIALWIVVVNIDDPVKPAQYTISVTQDNMDYLTSNGKYSETLGGKNTVTFTASAKRSILEKLSNTDFTAVADMEKIEYVEGDGVCRVPITITCSKYNSNTVTISSKQQYLDVTVEDLGNVQKKITASTEGTVMDGCALGDVSIVTSNLLKISGPSSVTSQISTVVATINVDGMSSDVTDTVVPVLYDADGNEIDASKLKMNINTVTITAQILNTKDVDLSFQTKGTVASGYTLKEITYSPKKVRIKGETDVLNKVAKIAIPDDVLDMSGATEDVETTVDITSYLPDGTSLVLAADAKVEVKVKVEPITTKTFEVDASAFTLENIPDATKAKITEDTIQVEVTGAESDIKKLSADDITGTVNLQGYGNGEHNIAADIDVDNELYQVKTVRIPVKMTAEDTEIKSTESSKKSASKTK